MPISKRRFEPLPTAVLAAFIPFAIVPTAQSVQDSTSSQTASAGAALPAEECIPHRDELLALDQQAFDQDLDGGWRPIAAREGCMVAAADLIREYRERASAASGSEDDLGILYWHEGQLRAMQGQDERAAELFRRSYRPDSPASWRHYAEATIAFIERDRDALREARDALAAIPEPEDWQERVRQMQEQHGFSPTWPANLDVVDGLIGCFDEPYSKAYGAECRPRE